MERRTMGVTAVILLGVLVCGGYANPNHLEPIAPYDPDGYNQAVFKSLVGKRPFVTLWMIEQPSFSPECAVLLGRGADFDPNASYRSPIRQVARDQWMIEYVVAKKQIWRYGRADVNMPVPCFKLTEEVERYRTTVTKDFAETMLAAWRSVLKTTRYPDERWPGADGTTFQFYCGYEYFGKTWSPDSGLPAMLVDLGHKLGELARPGAKNKKSLQRQALDLARKITQEAASQQKQK
jgi:hypothetical protein